VKARLTSRDDSSLVVDTLCDQAKGENFTITCFYFDFAALKEQTATNMLGTLLKQIVSGMGGIPWEISWAFWEKRKPIDGCEPQLVDIVRMLQAITSSQPTFVCIDSLDECVGVQRFRLLDPLKQILEKPPGPRIFMTGRSHILAEIEEHLAGRATSLSVSSTKNDIITHLRDRLDEDEKPDSMDENLEADILHKVPENISEMCVGKRILRTHPHYWLIGEFRFLLASLNIEAILEELTIYRRRE